MFTAPRTWFRLITKAGLVAGFVMAVMLLTHSPSHADDFGGGGFDSGFDFSGSGFDTGSASYDVATDMAPIDDGFSGGGSAPIDYSQPIDVSYTPAPEPISTPAPISTPSEPVIAQTPPLNDSSPAVEHPNIDIATPIDFTQVYANGEETSSTSTPAT